MESFLSRVRESLDPLLPIDLIELTLRLRGSVYFSHQRESNPIQINQPVFSPNGRWIALQLHQGYETGSQLFSVERLTTDLSHTQTIYGDSTRSYEDEMAQNKDPREEVKNNPFVCRRLRSGVLIKERFFTLIFREREFRLGIFEPIVFVRSTIQSYTLRSVSISVESTWPLLPLQPFRSLIYLKK